MLLKVDGREWTFDSLSTTTYTYLQRIITLQQWAPMPLLYRTSRSVVGLLPRWLVFVGLRSDAMVILQTYAQEGS